MPKLVCVECQIQYRLVKSGNKVIDMFLYPPQPYKVRNGDRWECPNCGHQIIAGFSELPLAEHYQDDFSGVLGLALEDENTIYCYEK